jgi:phosphoglucosamine mutase
VGRLFGTDGVRGVAGEDLTGRLATELAACAAELLHRDGAAQAHGTLSPRSAARRRPVAVVGRDTRASGEFLEAAVVAGLAGTGVDVLRLGVVPTPAVAFLTAELGADLGVVLSASHNPAQDNGIKFFGRGGFKLPDALEDELEAMLAQPGRRLAGQPASGFGRVRDARRQRERYLRHLLSTLAPPGGQAAGSPGGQGPPEGGPLPAPGPGHGRGTPRPEGRSHARGSQHAVPPPGPQPLAGLRVVVDCAHGAAFALAPALLRRAGAEVAVIGAQPDGENINAGCGSTHLDELCAAVVEHRADAGIAHDGDADRCLAVDADGQVIDGDQILAVLALRLHRAHRLARNTVVTTVMSNLGFRIAMKAAGIQVVETAVGDRHVLDAMRAGGFVLGGEQSGHIIMLDHATTGDGLLTALHLLAAAARERVSLAELASVMTRYPQVLVNVAGVDKTRVTASPALATAIAAAEGELGESGRVLVRPSGTEPAVRVMVESTDAGHAARVAARLAAAVRSAS